MQRAADGLSESEFDIEGTTYFRDTQGWKDFVSTSDSISSQLSSTRSTWESSMSSLTQDIKSKPLPPRPDV